MRKFSSAGAKNLCLEKPAFPGLFSGLEWAGRLLGWEGLAEEARFEPALRIEGSRSNPLQLVRESRS